MVEVWERDLLASQKWRSTQKEPKWPVFGQTVATVSPSEHRTTPLCEKYFGACGGCKHQHLVYEQQLQHKQTRVEALFRGQQHSPQMQVRPILGADAPDGIYHYRNKMEFTCSTGRWLLDSDKTQGGDDRQDGGEDGDADEAAPVQQHFSFTIGLFPVSSTSVRRARQIQGKRRRGKTNASWSPRILSIDRCSLQDPASNHILQRLSTLCEAAGLEAYNFQTNQGFLKQIVIRTGTNSRKQPEMMLGLVTSTFDGEQSGELKRIVDQLVQESERDHPHSGHAKIVSVVQRLDDQALRHQGRGDWVEKEQTLFGQSFFEDSILGHSFRVSFDSFFQPNTAQASRLYREIQNTLSANQELFGGNGGIERKPVIWDLFCGVGSIGICMGKFAEKVYGFEIVEAAVEKARANAQLNGYTSDEMQFFTMDLTKRWDEDEWKDRAIEKPDMVVVDPPRAGLHNKLIKYLRRLAPLHICYVSCNPESQVKDLELLCAPIEEGSSATASYEVEYLQPVDMLPHTPHIETIAWLRRRI